MVEKQPRVIVGTTAVCPACRTNTGLVLIEGHVFFALNAECPLCRLRREELKTERGEKLLRDTSTLDCHE